MRILHDFYANDDFHFPVLQIGESGLLLAIESPFADVTPDHCWTLWTCARPKKSNASFDHNAVHVTNADRDGCLTFQCAHCATLRGRGRVLPDSHYRISRIVLLTVPSTWISCREFIPLSPLLNIVNHTSFCLPTHCTGIRHLGTLGNLKRPTPYSCSYPPLGVRVQPCSCSSASSGEHSVSTLLQERSGYLPRLYVWTAKRLWYALVHNTQLWIHSVL